MDTSNHPIDMLFQNMEGGNSAPQQPLNHNTSTTTNNVVIKQEELEYDFDFVQHRKSEIAESNSHQQQQDNFADSFAEILASGVPLHIPPQHQLPPSNFPMPGLPFFIPPNAPTNIPPLPAPNSASISHHSLLEDLPFPNPDAHALFLASNPLSAPLPFFPGPVPPLFNPMSMSLGPPPPLMHGMPPPELFAAFPQMGGANWNPMLQHLGMPIPPKPNVPTQQTKTTSTTTKAQENEEEKKKKEESQLVHDQKQDWITEILSTNPVLQQAKIEVHVRTRSERHNSVHETNVYEKMYSSLKYIVKQYVTLPSHEFPVIYMKVKVIDYTSPLQQAPIPSSHSKLAQTASSAPADSTTTSQGNGTVIVLPQVKPGSSTAPQVSSSINTINSINNSSSNNHQSPLEILSQFMDKESIEKIAHQITMTNKVQGLNRVVKPEELANMIWMSAVANNNTNNTTNKSTTPTSSSTSSISTGNTTNTQDSSTQNDASAPVPAQNSTSVTNENKTGNSSAQPPSVNSFNLTASPYCISQSGSFMPSSIVILGLLKSCRTLEEKIHLLQSFKTNSEIKGKIVSELVPTVEVLKESKAASAAQSTSNTTLTAQATVQNTNFQQIPMFPFMTPTPSTPAPVPVAPTPPTTNTPAAKEKNNSVTYTSESKIQFSEVSYRQYCAFQFMYYLDEKCDTPVLCHISPPFQIFARKQNEKEGYALTVDTKSTSSNSNTSAGTSSPKSSTKKRSAATSESGSSKKAKNTETSEDTNKQPASSLLLGNSNTSSTLERSSSTQNKSKTARLEPAALGLFKERIVQQMLAKLKDEDEEDATDPDLDELFDKPKKDRVTMEQFMNELDGMIKLIDTVEENGVFRKSTPKEKSDAASLCLSKVFDLSSNSSSE